VRWYALVSTVMNPLVLQKCKSVYQLRDYDLLKKSSLCASIHLCDVLNGLMSLNIKLCFKVIWNSVSVLNVFKSV
jgi:hypothetical protein